MLAASLKKVLVPMFNRALDDTVFPMLTFPVVTSPPVTRFKVVTFPIVATC